MELSQDMTEVDSLLEEAFKPNEPIKAPSEGEVSQGQDPKTTEAPKVSDFVIKHEGKDISLDDKKYKMYAQMGYDYNQKMHKIRVDQNLLMKEREDFSNQRKTYDEQYGELKEIHEYAKQNPEWLDTVRQAWHQRQQKQIQGYVDPNNPYQQEMLRVKEQLNLILADREEDKRQKLMRETAEKDAGIGTQISEYKLNYPDFDWETADDTGLNLEKRIMQHALDTGTKSFKLAARDYLWDEHMKRAQLESKEKVAKDFQKQNKLGLGATTSKPQSQIKRSQNLRSSTYNDLANEALQEMGLA